MIVTALLVAFIVWAGFQVWYDCTHEDGLYKWNGKKWVRNGKGEK